MKTRLEEWQKEMEELSDNFKKLCRSRKKMLPKDAVGLVTYVAKKQQELVKRVCREWKEIAFVTRTKIFKETEQGEIDLFDVKCKEWGFLLRELFGSRLGTGDYGHLTIDHAPMLMRRFLSMTEFSQQGFEASHKDQRQLWLKASSHDRHGEASSIEQILVHFYAEKMLFLRHCLREALKAIQGKTCEDQKQYHFFFRGCGWKAKDVMWDSGDVLWIRLMDNLMTLMFGDDFLEYTLDENKTCYVHDDCKPKFVYNRDEWLSEYSNMIAASDDMTTDKKDGGVNLLTVSDDTDTAEHGEVSLLTPTVESLPVSDDIDTAEWRSSIESLKDSDTACIYQGLANNLTSADSVIAVFPPPPAMAKIKILQMDIDTLQDGKELNDSIVDFFLMHCAHTMDQELYEKSHIFSSFFTQSCLEE